jgi:CHAD domain-containing protein
MTTLAPDRPTVSRRTFTTPEPGAVRDLLRDGASLGVDVRRGPAVRYQEIALDTLDRRFDRAGYRLAVRDAGGRRELVLEPVRPTTGRRILRVRAPFAGTVESLPAACPEPLRDPVQAVVGRRRLFAAERMSSLHETWQLLREDRLVGAVVLKETTREEPASDAPAEAARVEIELDDQETAEGGVLDRLSSRLRLAPAGPSPAAPPAGTSHPGPVRAGPAASVQDVAFAALRLHFARALAREPGARLGADPEELHELRVAVRRLRAALRLWRDHLPGRTRRHGRELRRIGRALGGVRDLDVQIEWLREHAGDLPGRERDAVLAVVAALQRRRRAARREMLETLDSERTERFARRFAAWLRRGPRRKPRRGARPVADEAPRLVRDRMGTLLRAGKRFDATSPPAQYHALRILAKHARYALEFHADVYGRPARRLIRRLVRLQDLLGEHQDAEVFLDRIRALLEDDVAPPGSDASEALEHLAARRAERGRELRDRFPAMFERVRGKRWKRLRRRLRRA